MMTLDVIAPVVEESKDFVNGLDTLWVLLGAMRVFVLQLVHEGREVYCVEVGFPEAEVSTY